MSDEYTAVDAKIDAAYVAWLTANGLRHGDSYFAGATFAAGFRAALDTLIPVEPTPEIQEPGRSEDQRTAEERFLGATYVEDLSPIHGGLDETVEVLVPGRSEAEIKAEALREFADWWGAGQWADWFMTERVVDDMTAVQAMCKALTDRASRLAGTTEAGDES